MKSHRFSTDLTELLATFSDGPSLKNYTMPWDPSPWGTNNEDDVWGSMNATVGSRERELQFFAQRKGPEEKLRFLCYILIAHLPAEGLEETLEELKELFKFYVESVESPRFQIESVPSAQYVTHVGQPSTRPEMIPTE